jgi:hypothetical protein
VTDLDMSGTIAPKSDQLDAVDLLAGDRTFTIVRVTRNNDEQPFNFHFAEFPRPWRPNLSMRRVLMACWGPDAATYVGRRVTLYCDPDVQFGGAAVGGTRIRALSHMDKPKQVPLLVSKGRSKVYTVKPLKDAPTPALATSDAVTSEQLEAINAGLDGLGITEREAKLATVAQVVNRELRSARDLTSAEGSAVLTWIAAEEAADPEPTLPEGAGPVPVWGPDGE